MNSHQASTNGQVKAYDCLHKMIIFVTSVQQTRVNCHWIVDRAITLLYFTNSIKHSTKLEQKVATGSISKVHKQNSLTSLKVSYQIKFMNKTDQESLAVDGR